MIKYLGSKRTLVPAILSAARAISGPTTVIDLFSGTSRVGLAFKRHGYRVFSNDHNAYAENLALCYVQADRERQGRAAHQLVRELNALPGKSGHFTETYCQRSRFFHPKNGARIDAIREEIERKGLDVELRAVVLTSLMEAADRVDSTTGVQMAYLKHWAPRALDDLELRVPALLPRSPLGPGRAFRLDALEAVERLKGDVCYIDPPYNQHKYLGNYHVWESLILWDKPEVYGTACKRVDCRERTSAFNSRREAGRALATVFDRCRAKHLIVSFNNEGYLNRADLEPMLERRGHIVVIEQGFKRYVGAQIGIFNPRGVKVGKVSHLRNVEYLFVVSQDRDVIDRVRRTGVETGRAAPALERSAEKASSIVTGEDVAGEVVSGARTITLKAAQEDLFGG